jgi:hypothetical protein
MALATKLLQATDTECGGSRRCREVVTVPCGRTHISSAVPPVGDNNAILAGCSYTESGGHQPFAVEHRGVYRTEVMNGR